VSLYRITLDAWNHAGGSEYRVHLNVSAADPEQARQRIRLRTIYHNPITEQTNIDGGIGGVILDEWHIVSVRKSRAKDPFRKVPQGVLWVCDDCMFAREGEGNPDRPSALPEEWSRELSTDVTLGMLWSEHAEGCPNHKAKTWVAECDCERTEFSTLACDACGDWHHGARHAYTWWDYKEPVTF
jgi:hypothetical protein